MKRNEKKLDLLCCTIDITRKCNLKCAHCYRGEPEDKNIKEETLRNFLNSFGTIKAVELTGGEPMADKENLRMVLKNLRGRNIAALMVLTNGTILDDEIGEMLNDFGKYIQGEETKKEVFGKSTNNFLDVVFSRDVPKGVNVTISQSIFHDNDAQKAIDFYNQYEFINVDTTTTMIFKGGNREDLNMLIGDGRALENEEIRDKYFFATKQTPFRLKTGLDGSFMDEQTLDMMEYNSKLELQNTIVSVLSLSTNGNIYGTIDTFSWKKHEGNSQYLLGNINEYSFFDLFTRWQETHYCLEQEANELDMMLFKLQSLSDYAIYDEAEQLYNDTIELQKFKEDCRKKVYTNRKVNEKVKFICANNTEKIVYDVMKELRPELDD